MRITLLSIPAFQMLRRMDDMLYTINNYRTICSYINYAFNTKHVLSMSI